MKLFLVCLVYWAVSRVSWTGKQPKEAVCCSITQCLFMALCTIDLLGQTLSTAAVLPFTIHCSSAELTRRSCLMLQLAVVITPPGPSPHTAHQVDNHTNSGVPIRKNKTQPIRDKANFEDNIRWLTKFFKQNWYLIPASRTIYLKHKVPSYSSIFFHCKTFLNSKSVQVSKSVKLWACNIIQVAGLNLPE